MSTDHASIGRVLSGERPALGGSTGRVPSGERPPSGLSSETARFAEPGEQGVNRSASKETPGAGDVSPRRTVLAVPGDESPRKRRDTTQSLDSSMSSVFDPEPWRSTQTLVDDDDCIQEFISRGMRGDFKDELAVMSELEEIFPELDGRYLAADQARCVLLGCRAIFWFLGDDELAGWRRMRDLLGAHCPSKEMWLELRQTMRRAGPWSDSKYRTLLLCQILLVLGQSKVLRRELRMGVQDSAGQCALMLFESDFEFVPSLCGLEEDQEQLMHRVMKAHAAANFRDILDGNAPAAAIAQLHAAVLDDGPGSGEVMRFYLANALIDRAAIGGTVTTQGLFFLTERNCAALLAALDRIAHLDWSPIECYWGYMQHRAPRLHLSTSSRLDLALARLACVYRAFEPCDLVPLRAAWSSLDLSERNALAQLLAGDGINEPAWVLGGVHALLHGAKQNPAIGLKRALQFVLEALERVHASGLSKPQSTCVDFHDPAFFIREVKTPEDFEISPEFVQLSVAGRGEVRVLMTVKNWQRVRTERNRQDDRLPNVSRSLRRITKQGETLELLLRRNADSARRAKGRTTL